MNVERRFIALIDGVIDRAVFGACASIAFPVPPIGISAYRKDTPARAPPLPPFNYLSLGSFCTPIFA
jgi:hypothetical protein